MKPTYRVKDWAIHFENNRTRELKELRFVILPNKQDGDGYTELLDHPNGAAHFGAWCALVEVASKCKPRGTLLRNVGTIPQGGAGKCDGGVRPHDYASLNRLTRIPTAVLEEAIPRLLDIGWLEQINPQVQQNDRHRTIPQGGAGKCRPRARARGRTEENRTEKKKGRGRGGRSEFSQAEWRQYVAAHPGISNSTAYLKSAGTGKHDDNMKSWLEQNNGANRSAGHQTAVQRREEDFKRKLETVRKLQRESSGATDEDVRGKPG